ncbi:MAG: tyrosine-type recombinase/integrase [Steroidobacteraceae bacterium]
MNPHALRHAGGFHLAGEDLDTRALSHYLGHRSLQSTERYTAQSAARCKDFLRDWRAPRCLAAPFPRSDWRPGPAPLLSLFHASERARRRVTPPV